MKGGGLSTTKTSLLLQVVITILFGVLITAGRGVVCTKSAGGDEQQLEWNFYSRSCPNAESIVRDVIWSNVLKDSTLPAKLLRLHFHDCFVRGCDGSVLLNSTGASSTEEAAEKDAIPNMSLGGFDVIDEVKAQLEYRCPQIVSCADILALSARDAVSFQYKKRLWRVMTGRRDGVVSSATEALYNLPSPHSDFNTLKQNFTNKGLSVKHLVALSGAHTIGDSRCTSFSDRLYNFTGEGDVDSTLDHAYAASLMTQCKSSLDETTTVPMDPGSTLSFDNHYYVNLKKHKGLFTSDAVLLTDKVAAYYVEQMLNPYKFFHQFGQSMKKMGSIGVLTGNNGQIRKNCALVN